MNAPTEAGIALAAQQAALATILREIGEVAIALSGGVDSMTLAAFAHRELGSRATMFHARSPAVPVEATERVRSFAAERGWPLSVIDAREFDNGDYVANPVDRCFHCKSSLYVAIQQATRVQVVSGTNLDDLSDYRPGLVAARDRGVRHPFVEARMPKSAVRALARELGMPDIAEMPASPCLASRIETGIAIDADVLRCVHAVENLVRARLQPATVRCRVRAGGVVVELDAPSLARLPSAAQADLGDEILAIFRGTGYREVRFAPYVTGSAFLRHESHVRQP